MTTVSIVSPKAPKNVNATTRCARVGFGRSAGVGFGEAAVTEGAGSIGGVVKVGRFRVGRSATILAGTNQRRAGRSEVAVAETTSMARIATIALAVLACGQAAARDLQEVLNTGKLRVGVTLYAPWAARGADGELVGFEVDVARQLAADMGVEAQLFPYDLERLVPALEAGDIDLIAAGLTITPERALHVNFSEPYAQSGVGLATHVERTASVTDATALDDQAFTIAAVEDSVGAELARRLWPRARVQVFASVEAASEALLAGEVHGFVEDEPVPTFLALENPGVIDVPTGRPLLASPAGFAVNKGDPDFLAFLNAWITAREADTWLPTTASYWFESLRWQERLGNARR
jgi:polar amino acid transport system substrate-binding protein